MNPFRAITNAFRSELRPTRPNPWPKCPSCYHRSAPYDTCSHPLHGATICTGCCQFGGNHPPKKAEELAEYQEERDDQQH